MSIARINCSHGDHEQYRGFIRNIRKASKDIAIMLDTQGPEIRTGVVEDNTFLKEGSTFTLTTRKVRGDSSRVYVNYPGLVRDARKGDKIMIDSGFIELKVLRKTKTDIICRVLTGGALGSQKGVNHPNCLARIPSFTKKDRDDLRFGMTHNIDYVALSFVRTASDVKKVRSFLDKKKHVHILAKIENALAVRDMDEIIAVSDGVMVARGDLGVELPDSDVPVIQKEIIRKCNLAGKPVVTATQMLESMVDKPRPTRAEASDVANAILDGTDAVMLSEETAVGRFPSKAVDTMRRIAEATEPAFELKHRPEITSGDDAIADAVFDITSNLGVDKIVVATCSGHSARMVSKHRPNADIIAVTPTDHVVRRMGLYWGIVPLLIHDGNISSTRDLIYHSIHTAFRQDLVKRSDKVVVTAAHPFNIRGRTNLIELHSVKEILDRGPRRNR